MLLPDGCHLVLSDTRKTGQEIYLVLTPVELYSKFPRTPKTPAADTKILSTYQGHCFINATAHNPCIHHGVLHQTIQTQPQITTV